MHRKFFPFTKWVSSSGILVIVFSCDQYGDNRHDTAARKEKVPAIPNELSNKFAFHEIIWREIDHGILS